jgi:hypothetical protein
LSPAMAVLAALLLGLAGGCSGDDGSAEAGGESGHVGEAENVLDAHLGPSSKVRDVRLGPGPPVDLVVETGLRPTDTLAAKALIPFAFSPERDTVTDRSSTPSASGLRSGLRATQ